MLVVTGGSSRRRENSLICILLAGLFGGRAGKSETSVEGQASKQTEASRRTVDQARGSFSIQWLDPKRRSLCVFEREESFYTLLKQCLFLYRRLFRKSEQDNFRF
ncbi:hypothetical protein L798_13863 [Zootermopsis nevadensis]|uniref:Uncharacterized protein n=1 Tax=Zootermopsis nevadensis TaxID=136037 RepID=A0A067R2Q1_ZOONE|nr:hypothetical protein L798_13863 [Zootermopsis nevadensis]